MIIDHQFKRRFRKLVNIIRMWNNNKKRPILQILRILRIYIPLLCLNNKNVALYNDYK